MWFWIWSVLVAATLVGAFFLGRDLWRKAKTTMRAAGGLADTAGSLSDAIDEHEKNPTTTTPRGPDLFSDRVELAERVAARRRATASRKRARRGAHAARYETWRTIDL